MKSSSLFLLTRFVNHGIKHFNRYKAANSKPKYEKPEEVLEADPPEHMTPHDPSRVLWNDEHDSNEDHEAKKGDKSAAVTVPCVRHQEELDLKSIAEWTVHINFQFNLNLHV